MNMENQIITLLPYLPERGRLTKFNHKRNGNVLTVKPMYIQGFDKNGKVVTIEISQSFTPKTWNGIEGTPLRLKVHCSIQHRASTRWLPTINLPIDL